MKSLTYKRTLGLDGIEDAMTVRRVVFHNEQGFTEEVDRHDKDACHVVLYDVDRPIATGRAYPYEGDVYKIGRVAVLKNYRTVGAGRQVMAALEKYLREQGARFIQLSAQKQAVRFYQKLGYRAQGEWYMDEHCPHIDMRKHLT